MCIKSTFYELLPIDIDHFLAPGLVSDPVDVFFTAAGDLSPPPPPAEAGVEEGVVVAGSEVLES